MSAHRYWGLGLLARAGSGNGISLAEVEMRGAPGGPDLCVGGVASGTSTGGFVAANAFDNNNLTEFYNGSTSGLRVRLAYDFLTPVSISEIWLRMSSSTYPGATFGPRDCRVDWSDDGVIWFTSRGFYTGDIGSGDEITVSGIGDDLPTGKSLPPPAKIQGAETPLSTPRVPPRHTFVRDIYYGGLGRITGTVKEKATPSNVPLARRVRLFRERDGHFIRETFSDAVTGAYAFENIDATVKYTVVAYDYTNNYRAVIGDNLTPDPMP